MNNDQFIYDMKQNRKYNCLFLINMIIGFIFFIIMPIILIQDGTEIFHNKYTVLILVIFLIVFIANIFFIKKIKLSNAKYYIFELNNKISFEKIKEALSSIDDRELFEEDVFLKRIKLKENSISKYRILCYKTKDFNKNTFNNIKNDIHKKYNKKYDLEFKGRGNTTGEKGRINLIIADKLNEELDKFMSSNATGLNTYGIMMRTINICIIGNKMYIQPIKKCIEIPHSTFYFGISKKTYNFLNNIK